MKLLFKTILLTTTMVITLNQTSAISRKSDVVSAFTAQNALQIPKNITFKSEDQQSAYALGASLGFYIGNSLKEQEKLGVKLDKQRLIAGVQDAFIGKSKLSDNEIEQTLKAFEELLKGAAQAKMAKDSKKNAEIGSNYSEEFAKEKGVKKTKSGLLYQIEKEGTDKIPKDSDTVLVNYKGTLLDGTEFDNSYMRGEPLSFRLDGVIPGWTEGLKHVKKGGKIKLVIPPKLAYGENGVPGIPSNSTLVFDIDLLDIKSETEANEKSQSQSFIDGKAH